MLTCLCMTRTWFQRRALDPLELELQMVVSHHVGAGNPLWSSRRVASVVHTAPSLQPEKEVLGPDQKFNIPDELS